MVRLVRFTDGGEPRVGIELSDGGDVADITKVCEPLSACQAARAPRWRECKNKKMRAIEQSFLGHAMHARRSLALSPSRRALLQADPSIPNDMRALLTDADGIAKARRCVCQSCRSHAARVFEHTAARQNVCVGDARLNGS
jgi:hypothetical protein